MILKGCALNTSAPLHLLTRPLHPSQSVPVTPTTHVVPAIKHFRSEGLREVRWLQRASLVLGQAPALFGLAPLGLGVCITINHRDTFLRPFIA